MLKIVFTLFNLQGTDALSEESFWIISHSKLFVKNFFRAFSNFFEVIFLVAALASNPVILSHLVELVKNFFRFFSKFSKLWCRAPSFRFSSHNFLSIPHQVSFVKNFFQILSNFAWFWHFLAALADSLRILSYRSSFVKRKL